ncbi:V-type ATP synthase subunit D [Candidatus Peregrinibacteria bacterium]|nr:V-type ATP synthase subunit D [Candidatus Peregrinibacteria bacterium]
MAKLNVKPTRMELLNLKKRIKSAKRGHKLLKDKQDGLMKTFMEIIREAKKLRREVEEKLTVAFKNFAQASSMMMPEVLESALLYPSAKVDLEVTTKNVMSVYIPYFKVQQEGDILNYGYLQTSAELDSSLGVFQEVFPMLIKLAEIERQAERLAAELETTRRRVNALEYKMIPDLEETIKFISMKLAETERSTIVSVMRIKAMIEESSEKTGA